ncbi:IS66 family insertion sequence element accessory protein TnpA [Bacillus fonticola]
MAEYKASGKSQTKWCEDNGLKIHQFKYRLYKVIERGKIKTEV